MISTKLPVIQPQHITKDIISSVISSPRIFSGLGVVFIRDLLEGSGNTMDFGTQCSVEPVKPPKLDGKKRNANYKPLTSLTPLSCPSCAVLDFFR